MWVRLFADNNEIELIGESKTLQEAIEMLKAKNPDIVLLDINLPDASGLDAVPLIQKFSPATGIIVVSMHDEPVYAQKMLNLGAKGYVTKSAPHHEIIEAINIVAKGGKYISKDIENKV